MRTSRCDAQCKVCSHWESFIARVALFTSSSSEKIPSDSEPKRQWSASLHLPFPHRPSYFFCWKAETVILLSVLQRVLNTLKFFCLNFISLIKNESKVKVAFLKMRNKSECQAFRKTLRA